MQLYNTIVFLFLSLAKLHVVSWLWPKALIHLQAALLKSTKNRREKKAPPIWKLTSDQQNHTHPNTFSCSRFRFFVITVHITTCKCRQTLAEVQLLHRVNQDTRQIRERKVTTRLRVEKCKPQHWASNRLLFALKKESLASGPEPFKHSFILFYLLYICNSFLS